jgi:signal transduction histidine kinase
VSVLGALALAWLRQRSPARRLAAWVLAIAGPALLTVAALPLGSSLVLGGFLFSALIVVIVVALIGGKWPALTGVVLTTLARVFLFAPPFVGSRPDLRPNVVSVVGFAVAGAAVAILIGDLAQVAEKQASSGRVEAALRRVATLVARAAPADELFAAVTEEVGRLIGGDFARLARYGPEGTLTFVAAWSRIGEHFPVGSRWAVAGQDNIGALVRRTGRPARIDNFDGISGPLAADARERGIRTAAGVPIIVDGHIWGVIFAGSTLRQPLPPDTEARLSSFTDLLATAIANAEHRGVLARLADEQAALRRVATLVARGAPPDELFAAVPGEIGQLIQAGQTTLYRYEPENTVTAVAAWRLSGDPSPAIGARLPLGGNNLTTIISQTRRPARVDNYADASTELGRAILAGDLRSAAGAPIIVQGRLWGVMIAGAIDEHGLPADTEARLASFTELVATAISNADSRAGLTRLAEEQAALRRVATLVARGALPDELFAAVPGEVGQLLQATQMAMIRYSVDGTSTVVANWSATGEAVPPIGSTERLGGKNLTTIISQTGAPARIDSYADASGAPAVAARGAGLRSAAGAPIIVQGRVWGAMIASAVDDRPMALDTEVRLASFTELLATAIANAENLAQLTASRARVVAAADETRRRIERDLHDGAQQRLVSLGFAVQAAQMAVPPEVGELRGELAQVAEGLASVLDDLREMARGIHPAILAQGGLAPALKTLARRSSVPVELDLRAVARLPERIEVAAYYVVSEALANAAKHAHANVVHVDADADGPALCLRIRDDGAGGADPAGGTGLVGLKDRVEALGGTIRVQSPAGAGTSLHVELPLAN